jgi:sec-independent protein translocase protein TatC
LAAGVVFLIPIFSFFLSKVGILTPQFMKTYRKHAYVVMLLLSAIITPPDIFSQIMVCFPLVFLYEIGIMISRSVVKKREKEMDEI